MTLNFAVKKVDLKLSVRIQQARTKAGLTQKDLALKINEKTTVVNEYESGKAIPSNAVISKMEKALGVSLRGAE